MYHYLDNVKLPSVWPETYSYTLSIALQAGLPVAAFDIGAIARRIRAFEPSDGHCLYNLELAKMPDRLNERFVKWRSVRVVTETLRKVG